MDAGGSRSKTGYIYFKECHNIMDGTSLTLKEAEKCDKYSPQKSTITQIDQIEKRGFI